MMDGGQEISKGRRVQKIANSLLMGMSIVTFCLSICILLTFSNRTKLDVSGYYVYLIDAFIVLAVLVFLVTAYGFLAMLDYSCHWFKIYLFLLLFVGFLVLPYSLSTFICSDMMMAGLEERLRKLFIYDYSVPGFEDTTHLVDTVQKEMTCCGVLHYSDWQNSTALSRVNEANIGGVAVPKSCCLTKGEDCNLGLPGDPNVKKIHTQPCDEAVRYYLRVHLDLFIAFSFLILLLTLFALIWGTIYHRAIVYQPAHIKETVIDRLFFKLGYETIIRNGDKYRRRRVARKRKCTCNLDDDPPASAVVHQKGKTPLQPAKPAKPAEAVRTRPHVPRSKSRGAIRGRDVDRDTRDSMATKFWHIGGISS